MGGAGRQRLMNFAPRVHAVHGGRSARVQKPKRRAMRLTLGVLSSLRRLLPAVYGISKAGVRVDSGIPPSSTAFSVGDDSYFITQTACSDFQICGVADGVGGWHSHGVEPSHFSSDLMASCSKMAYLRRGHLESPKEILKWGFEELLWVHHKSYGSSTACILSLDCRESILHAAYLGDSGFVIIRDGKVIGRSDLELVHYFNCPFQLSNPPPSLLTHHAHTSKFISDSPSSAIESAVDVHDGDVVVLATDGLFSNVYNSEIVEVVEGLKDYREETEVKRVCVDLVERAWRYSLDETYLSPFAREGSEALSWDFCGGKKDDITVIVASVVSDNDG